MFVVVDTSFAIQMMYDLLLFCLCPPPQYNQSPRYSMCGNNNGTEENYLSTLQGEAIDANSFGWSRRIPQQEARCTADCGDLRPRCTAEQLREKNAAAQWLSLHEYM